MKTKNKIRGFVLVSAAAATPLFSLALVAPSLFGEAAWSPSHSKTLTFAERVKYQRAIEEVYWHHRIWPKQNGKLKPSLDAVMSEADIEKKVEDYLRNSQLLADDWHHPLSAAQLQDEMNRMAQHTEQPEVLREIFAALGNDPFVVAECLARPTLAESSLMNLHSSDQISHGELAESARTETESATTTTMATGKYILPKIPDVATCINNSWTATNVTNAPASRTEHTAIWTGTEMIVWGGYSDNLGFNTGGKYNPSTDSWTATSTANAPFARWSHSAVWTGNEMIVWGGSASNTGGRYNPATNSWTATSISKAPTGRWDHTAVWTGSEMIVWGGLDAFGFVLNTGGKYNPNTNSWTSTSTTNAPDARYHHTAIWTASEMIIWGGGDVGQPGTAPAFFKTGRRYNPNTDTWTATSTTNAPVGRFQHTAVWTGNEMIVWGGTSQPGVTNTGGRYCAESAGSQLGNISTRSFVQTGDNVMIGGFIVQGAQTKRLIIRAIGPELTQYGVPNALANTTLELHDRTGALIASNDDWQHTILGGVIIRNQAGDIQNSGHAPADGRESAIIADLAPGNYTAIVRGINNTTGVALVEVYDLSNDASSILGNISTRSFVQTDNNVMIGGFIVQGTGAKRVIIRAIGPELSQFGVPDPLANPSLELHNATGALIGSNDDWQQTIIGGVITHSQVADIQNSGHAPANPSESAIIAELPPGNYTAIVRGVNNTTGVALVEVYDLDR